MADAMSKVREAINLLEMALPAMPIGSEPHTAVVKALPSLSKAFPASESVPGIQNTQLQALQKKAQESQMLQQVTRALGAQGGGGAPGGPQAPAPQPQAM